jgi:hypothetical protein
MGHRRGWCILFTAKGIMAEPHAFPLCIFGIFARGFSWHVETVNDWSIYASRTTDSKQIMEAE